MNRGYSNILDGHQGWDDGYAYIGKINVDEDHNPYIPNTTHSEDAEYGYGWVDQYDEVSDA